jgi:glycosyltransferase involved in cell wall biosynthesis
MSLEFMPRVVYVINSFDHAGAEAGLLAIVKGGLFKDCRLTIVGLVRGRGGIDARLSELGHTVCILCDRPRMRPWDLPAIFTRLWRLLARERPDILIASLPQANLLSRICVLWNRRPLFISFEHNTHLAKPIYEVGFRMTSSRVDWAFADAAATLNQAVERLYRRAPRRQTVVPLVSFTIAASSVYSPSADGQLRIVSAARFTTTKNQRALIEAVAILNRNQRNVMLTLYGDGPERRACEELATRLNIGTRVVFAGFVPGWARQPADLFVLTSNHEGLCIVVLEAMHAGIPVIAPLIGGLRDYGAPELMHCLAAVDPPSVAAAIAAVMDGSLELSQQVSTAADMIDQRFGADSVARVYADINAALICAVRSAPARRSGLSAGLGLQ